MVQRKVKLANGNRKDGYAAVQLGLVENRKAKRVTKAMQGHFKKAGLPPCRVLREFSVDEGAEVKVGDKVSVAIFATGEKVTVTGDEQGQGLPGRREAPPFPRRPRDPRLDVPPRPRLDRRLRVPVARPQGHARRRPHGSDRVTVKNLEVVRVDAEKNLLVVRGCVPGASGGYVVINKRK